jgi:hypothetical protein
MHTVAMRAAGALWWCFAVVACGPSTFGEAVGIPQPVAPVAAPSDHGPAQGVIVEPEEVESLPEVQAAPEPAAEPVTAAPARPAPEGVHPLIAGLDRELRAWLTENEARALGRGLPAGLTGTDGGDTRGLAELLRYRLFRELGGRAIVATGRRPLMRWGREIMRLPRVRSSSGEAAIHAAYAGVDAYLEALPEESRGCRAERSEPECVTLEASWRAAGRVAHAAYGEIDPATMRFAGGGPSSPTSFRELLVSAELAGVERAVIRQITVRLLRDLVAAAR